MCIYIIICTNTTYLQHTIYPWKWTWFIFSRTSCFLLLVSNALFFFVFAYCHIMSTHRILSTHRLASKFGAWTHFSLDIFLATESERVCIWTPKNIPSKHLMYDWMVSRVSPLHPERPNLGPAAAWWRCVTAAPWRSSRRSWRPRCLAWRGRMMLEDNGCNETRRNKKKYCLGMSWICSECWWFVFTSGFFR